MFLFYHSFESDNIKLDVGGLNLNGKKHTFLVHIASHVHKMPQQGSSTNKGIPKFFTFKSKHFFKYGDVIKLIYINTATHSELFPL